MSASAQKSASKIKALADFIKTDIWRIRSSRLSKNRYFLIRQLRIVLLAVRGFNEDKCLLRASALTFFTMLSIVPVVAMAFGIAKGFGFEKILEKKLLENFAGQEEVVSRVISFAQNLLVNTQGGLIAGIGVAVLFWSVIKVLGQIESAFNDIWGIQNSRSVGRKFSDYLSVMLICPVLLIMSGSVTVLISSQVALIVERLSFLGPVGEVILFSLKVLPYAVVWGVFSFLYVFMPNGTVNIRAGILGGIIAGTIYQAWQFLYITFQVGASKYGAIYGSFAALPLFLVWLQVSWFIILFGAEIAFAEQNVETYELEPDCLKASRAFKRRLALAVTYICVARFRDGKEPLSAAEIAGRLELPIRLVREAIHELELAGILLEVKGHGNEKTRYYIPARDINQLTVQAVLEGVDQSGVDTLEVPSTREFNVLKDAVDDLTRVAARSEKNILLKDI
jgi:membrane protein